jgi:polyhydroxyalkanoate synthesis regulator phasin
MIAKAHEISLEAGSKMAKAMKDVIFAAAGLTPFAAESAKDLVNYMVRRGQMSADEADRILREIEDVTEKTRPVVAAKAVEAPAPTAKKSAPAAKKEPAAKEPVAKKAAASTKEPVAKAPAAKAPVAKAPAAKKAAAPKKK